ncbi:hypothetical protein K502DRAFT_117319 [Neoconidiobolus thromboides FSU 785]|nr:hypothetical protein K502DRAFT_117319 [Neoconidiobolus thromboides FSU 785]
MEVHLSDLILKSERIYQSREVVSEKSFLMHQKKEGIINFMNCLNITTESYLVDTNLFYLAQIQPIEFEISLKVIEKISVKNKKFVDRLLYLCNKLKLIKEFNFICKRFIELLLQQKQIILSFKYLIQLKEKDYELKENIYCFILMKYFKDDHSYYNEYVSNLIQYLTEFKDYWGLLKDFDQSLEVSNIKVYF